MLTTPLAFLFFYYPTLLFTFLFFYRLFYWQYIYSLKLFIMDYLFGIILIFIVTITKTLAVGVGIFILYKLYHRYIVNDRIMQLAKENNKKMQEYMNSFTKKGDN